MVYPWFNWCTLFQWNNSAYFSFFNQHGIVFVVLVSLQVLISKEIIHLVCILARQFSQVTVLCTQ